MHAATYDCVVQRMQEGVFALIMNRNNIENIKNLEGKKKFREWEHNIIILFFNIFSTKDL